MSTETTRRRLQHHDGAGALGAAAEGARAVDNQLFVATCSPARNPEASYQAWGHSTAIDPFGKASLAYLTAWSLALSCK